MNNFRIDKLEIDFGTAVKRKNDVFLSGLEYAIKKGKGEILEYKTRWPIVNRYFGGGIPTDAIMVIGARPGKGKSAISAMIEDDIFDLNQNTKSIVLFWNWEMPGYQQGIRFFSRKLRREYRDIVSSDNPLNTEDVQNLKSAISGIANHNTFYFDVPQSSNYIYKANEQVKAKYPEYQLINIFDHTRLAKKNAEKKEEEKIFNLLYCCSLTNKQFGSTNIVLSQLNRDYENRNSSTTSHSNYKEPVISDLFGADAVGQFANIVVLPHFPKDFRVDLWEVNFPNTAPDYIDTEDLMIWEVAKNRNGPLGRIYFKNIPENFLLETHEIYNKILNSKKS